MNEELVAALKWANMLKPWSGHATDATMSNALAVEVYRQQSEIERLKIALSLQKEAFDLLDKNLAAERSKRERLEQDIEQGFMKGAYARLSNLQKAESQLAAEREASKMAHADLATAQDFGKILSQKLNSRENWMDISMKLDELIEALAAEKAANKNLAFQDGLLHRQANALRERMARLLEAEKKMSSIREIVEEKI